MRDKDSIILESLYSSLKEHMMNYNSEINKRYKEVFPESRLKKAYDKIRLEILSQFLLGERLKDVEFFNKKTEEIIIPADSKITKNKLSDIIKAFDKKELDLKYLENDEEKNKKIAGVLINILKPTHNFPFRPTGINQLIDNMGNLTKEYGFNSAWDVFHEILLMDVNK